MVTVDRGAKELVGKAEEDRLVEVAKVELVEVA